MNRLKKTCFIALLSFSICTLSSCSDDDGGSTPSNNSSGNQAPTVAMMVGTWGMVSLDYVGQSTNGPFTTDFSGVGKDFTYMIIFNDNPKTYTTMGGYTIALTTTILGSSVTQDTPISNVVGGGTWDLNGTELTLTDNVTQQPSTSDILSSSNNSFSIDYAGFSGTSTGGAAVDITSGQVTFNRK